MSTTAWLLLGWLAAGLVSVVPAFMPPMWAVLGAFAIGADVPLLPLTLGAAVTGALGRAVLALLTRRLRPLLSERDRRNADSLGNWFARRGRWKWIFVVLYCAGPFPSNVLFIAAGAGRIALRPVTICYAAARAVSDSFWVWVAVSVGESVRALLSGSVTDWRAIAGQVIGVALVVLVLRLPWERWLDEH